MVTFSDEAMSHAEQVLQKVYDEWLKRPGVTAVDLGFKWTKGEMTNQLAIRVHVSKKRPLPEIEEAERFPDEIEGVSIDVIEAVYGIQQLGDDTVGLEAAVDGRQQRFDEIPIGVSIGSPHVTAGTLGAKVIDNLTDDEMILSNWHILAGKSTAAAGLNIWQPGLADGRFPSDSPIANLTRFVLGPYDAAVARISGARPIKSVTLEGDPIEEAMAPRLGMRVWKSGRTTGRTEGLIDGVHMSIVMNYGEAGSRTLREVLRIVPRPGSGPVEISAGGDSGSVWVDQESGKAVGLHFGGEIGNAPEHALANDVIKVIEQLQVRFPGKPVAEEPPPIDAPVPIPDPEPDPTPDPIIDPPPVPDPAPIPDPDPAPIPMPDAPKSSFWQRFSQWLSRLFRW